MKKKYRITFKMSGGTIIKTKEFMQACAVIYSATNGIPPYTTEIVVEDLDDHDAASYEVNDQKLSRSSLEGLKTFVGGQ